MILPDGGGFKSVSEKKLEPQAKYLAERGTVSIRCRYRLISDPAAEIPDCAEDAISAMRWVRANAGLGGPNKGDTPDPRDKEGKAELGQYVKTNQPPMIRFSLEPKNFIEFDKIAGKRCELITYEGEAHSFFNKDKYCELTIAEADQFLTTSAGWQKRLEHRKYSALFLAHLFHSPVSSLQDFNPVTGKSVAAAASHSGVPALRKNSQICFLLCGSAMECGAFLHNPSRRPPSWA